MGQVLGIPKPEQSPRCTSCHALAPLTAVKGRDFEIADGVSCESCHGPSSQWLGPHSVKGTSYAQLLERGMVNTKDLVSRSEVCLGCHLGDSTRSVDHEMIAAGHPALVFDLESYSAAMPPHWKSASDRDFVLRTWAVGQAVELRESLRRLARHAANGAWPEYSEYECFACHHALRPPEKSWRISAGYPMRQPGNPPWNAAHFVVLRILTRVLEPEASNNLELSLAEVLRLTSSVSPVRAEVKRSADTAADVAHRLSSQLSSRTYTLPDAARFADELSSGAGRVADAGPRSAEQAAMAIESLGAVFGREHDAEFQAAVKSLFREIDAPSAYDAPRFASQLQKSAALLR